MKLTGETKFFLGIIIFTLFIVAIASITLSQPQKPLPKDQLVSSDASYRGPKDSANYLVEFSDFQCPACKAFSDEVDKLAIVYQDKLLIVFRHFPLPQHLESKRAAQIAESAGAQGKFWEMGKKLFENQSDLSEYRYASISSELDIDWKKIQEDLKSAKYLPKIETDVAYGNRIGIRATPTFYLNGIKLTVNTPEDLTKQVSKLLE